MDATPLFTVITISYNNLSGLKTTGASVQAQSCTDYEWIIIDGGSNDGSADFLRSAPARIISEADNGIYDAMNKGISIANGQYVIFMNAGDIFIAPDTLEKIKSEILKQNATPDFIYGDALEQTDSAQPAYKKARPHTKIRHGMFTHHQAMLYKRSLLTDMRYNENYKIAADYDLTLRFLKCCTHILYCPYPLCVFERGGISQRQTTLGRKEQFISRRQNKAVSYPANLTIYTLQAVASTLKRFFPQIYWALKSHS